MFYDLAIVISGGLLIGTLLTLGVVPVLYTLLVRDLPVALSQATTAGDEQLEPNPDEFGKQLDIR